MEKILHFFELYKIKKEYYFNRIKSNKTHYIIFVYVKIVLLACSPIIVAMLAGFIGSCLGCNINEAGTDYCFRLGIPFGIILSVFGSAGWAAMVTLPAGVIALVVWTIYCIVIWLKNLNTKS